MIALRVACNTSSLLSGGPVYCDHAPCLDRYCTEAEHFAEFHRCGCGWCSDCAASMVCGVGAGAGQDG